MVWFDQAIRARRGSPSFTPVHYHTLVPRTVPITCQYMINEVNHEYMINEVHNMHFLRLNGVDF